MATSVECERALALSHDVRHGNASVKISLADIERLAPVKSLFQAKPEAHTRPLVVIDAIARHRSDVIVMGKHGRSRVWGALLGKVAEYVLGSARCDVLLSCPAAGVVRATSQGSWISPGFTTARGERRQPLHGKPVARARGVAI